MTEFGNAMDFRCDQHPPSKTFERYFKAVPPGVSDIRATGHISVGGADVWMRFRIEETALVTITRGYTKLSLQESRKAVEHLVEESGIANPPTTRPNPSEEHRVHWDGLRRITQPVAYSRPNEAGGNTTWLVIDAPRRLAYFYHWNQ